MEQCEHYCRFKSIDYKYYGMTQGSICGCFKTIQNATEIGNCNLRCPSQEDGSVRYCGSEDETYYDTYAIPFKIKTISEEISHILWSKIEQWGGDTDVWVKMPEKKTELDLYVFTAFPMPHFNQMEETYEAKYHSLRDKVDALGLCAYFHFVIKKKKNSKMKI